MKKTTALLLLILSALVTLVVYFFLQEREESFTTYKNMETSPYERLRSEVETLLESDTKDEIVKADEIRGGCKEGSQCKINENCEKGACIDGVCGGGKITSDDCFYSVPQETGVSLMGVACFVGIYGGMKTSYRASKSVDKLTTNLKTVKTITTSSKKSQAATRFKSNAMTRIGSRTLKHINKNSDELVLKGTTYVLMSGLLDDYVTDDMLCEMMLQTWLTIPLDNVMQFAINNILKGSSKILKHSSKMLKPLTRAAWKAAAKMTKKIILKTSIKLSLKLGVKAMQSVAVAASRLASLGPVGMLIVGLEVVFAVLDMIDIGGHNKRITDRKAVIDQFVGSHYARTKINEGKWPLVYGAKSLCVDEYKGAMSKAISLFIADYFSTTIKHGTEKEKNTILKLMGDEEGTDDTYEMISKQIFDSMEANWEKTFEMISIEFKNELRIRNLKSWDFARRAPFWYYASKSELSLSNWDDIQVTPEQVVDDDIYIEIVKKSGLHFEQTVRAYKLNDKNFSEDLIFLKNAKYMSQGPCAEEDCIAIKRQSDYGAFFTQSPANPRVFILKDDLPESFRQRKNKNNMIHAHKQILTPIDMLKTIPVFPEAEEIKDKTWSFNMSPQNPVPDTRGTSPDNPSWWILSACYQRFLFELAAHPGLCINMIGGESMLNVALNMSDCTESEECVWLRGVFKYKGSYYVAPCPRPWHEEKYFDFNKANKSLDVLATEAMSDHWNELHLNIFKCGAIFDQITPFDKYGTFIMPFVSIYSDSYPSDTSGQKVINRNGKVNQDWKPKIKDKKFGIRYRNYVYDCRGCQPRAVGWSKDGDDTILGKNAYFLDIASEYTRCVGGVYGAQSQYSANPFCNSSQGCRDFKVDVRHTEGEGATPVTVEGDDVDSAPCHRHCMHEAISFDQDKRMCILNPSGKHDCDSGKKYYLSDGGNWLNCHSVCRAYHGETMEYKNVGGTGRCMNREDAKILESAFSTTLVRWFW